MKIWKQVVTGIAVLSAALLSVPASAQVGFFDNPLLGKAAEDFTLPTLKSGTVNMSAYRDGDSAIVFFWATWCPHCRRALSVLKAKKEEFKSKNIKLILVDSGEGADEVRAYLEKASIDMDVFLDQRNSLEEPYRIIGVPTLVFIDKKGIVRGVKHSLPENYDAFFKG